MSKGLSFELTRHFDIEVVGIAKNESAIGNFAKSLAPNIVIIDTDMPELDVSKILAELQEQPQSPKTLLFTDRVEPFFVFDALKNGLNGYFLKTDDSSLIVNALRVVLSGQVWLPANLAQGLVQSNKESGWLNKLTRRETEVLNLLAQGLANKQIAYQVQLSQRTVRYHLSNIYDKLHVEGRGEAIAWAIRHGFAYSNAIGLHTRK